MSKKDKVVNKNKVTTKDNDKREYRNPAETIWGKFIIWFLIIGMVATVVVSLVLALINATK